MEEFPEECPCGRTIRGSGDDGYSFLIYYCEDCGTTPPPVERVLRESACRRVHPAPNSREP